MSQKRFFCLRGFMKSGTNWLGSLLSSHESISVVGEFHWQDIVSRFNESLKRLPVYEEEEYKEHARCQLEDMIRNCAAEQAEPTATLIGERTPHSIIPVAIRNVPHISIIRDGRDILVSRAFHLYNSSNVHRLFERIPAMAETHRHFKADPWFFQKNPDQLLNQETMVRESMAFWREHLKQDQLAVELYPKLPIRFVKYEELHRDTQGERAKLFKFLDVDPSRAANIEGVLRAGFKTERPSEFLRKGVVGDWQNYFTDDTKKWFKEEAGQQLIDFDYESSLKW
ncbi:MAG: hypothetical protein ACI87E_000481 [Mariniblastus sp.]|jgi:hypothetical protein